MNFTRTQPSLSRDFAILSLLIMFILVLVSIWVAVETINTYENDVAKEMESEALRLDRALIVEIENAAYILESLGRQIQATGENPENIAQLYFSFAKSGGAQRSIFSWVNKAQMITVSNNLGVLDTPIDVSDRDYVKKAIAEPWKVHIGRPIDGRLSGKWVLPLALGITDKNGTYIGSVVVALDASMLSEDIGRTMKDSGIRIAITNLALTLLTQGGQAERFFSEDFDVNTLSKSISRRTNRVSIRAPRCSIRIGFIRTTSVRANTPTSSFSGSMPSKVTGRCINCCCRACSSFASLRFFCCSYCGRCASASFIR